MVLSLDLNLQVVEGQLVVEGQMVRSIQPMQRSPFECRGRLVVEGHLDRSIVTEDPIHKQPRQRSPLECHSMKKLQANLLFEESRLVLYPVEEGPVQIRLKQNQGTSK
jgi:hypothetical protein